MVKVFGIMRQTTSLVPSLWRVPLMEGNKLLNISAKLHKRIGFTATPVNVIRLVSWNRGLKQCQNVWR
jgi:hypothetical protein